MKNILMNLFLAITIGCSNYSSSDEFEHIKDLKARKIVATGIDKAGGIDKWRKMKELSFEKTSALYFEDGTIEDSSKQTIRFSFIPEFSANIYWTRNSDMHMLNFRNDTSFYFINDSIVMLNGEKNRNLVFSSLYTIGMPFKLLDEGVLLQFNTTDTIGDVEVNVVTATYEDKKNDSESEDWWYYFDLKSGELLGSKVFHKPTYAMIWNRSYENVDGMKLPSFRQSYRVDGEGNIKFLRAEFTYKNFTILY